MGIRGELYSTTVSLQNRTYFFNVKENRLGDLYLNIVESKNKDTGGFDRQSVVLFADDLQSFLKGFDESLKVMEKAVREKKKDGSPAFRAPRERDADSGTDKRESAPREREDREERKSNPFEKRPSGDREERKFSGRPSGDRPFNRERSSGHERPSGDRPFSRERPSGHERPSGDRPFSRERPSGHERPFGRPSGDRPFSRDQDSRDRPAGDRPFNRDRSSADRPVNRDRPGAYRPFNRDQGTGERPAHHDRHDHHDHHDRTEAPRFGAGQDRAPTYGPSGRPPFSGDAGPRKKFIRSGKPGGTYGGPKSAGAGGIGKPFRKARTVKSVRRDESRDRT